MIFLWEKRRKLLFSLAQISTSIQGYLASNRTTANVQIFSILWQKGSLIAFFLPFKREFLSQIEPRMEEGKKVEWLWLLVEISWQSTQARRCNVKRERERERERRKESFVALSLSVFLSLSLFQWWKRPSFSLFLSLFLSLSFPLFRSVMKKAKNCV